MEKELNPRHCAGPSSRQRSGSGGMWRWFIRFVALAILLWVAAVVALYVFRQDLIYPFRDWPRADRLSSLPGVRVEVVTASDGIPITVWITDARPGKPTILHFMGNDGSIESAAVRLTEFALAGYGTVAMNYRGAGSAPGVPSQVTITADALAIYDALPTLTAGALPPVIYGASLGAAVATQVASRRSASAVILGAPFSRLCETAQYHYPFVPACLILHDEVWDSLTTITDVRAPLLILHGDQDQVIPLSQGRKLFDAAGQPKQMIVYPGGHHDDLRKYGSARDMFAFLGRLGL